MASFCRLVLLGFFSFSLSWVFSPPPALAQERPYFVAYDHYLEEPGNLEIEYFSTYGTQRGAGQATSDPSTARSRAAWSSVVYPDGMMARTSTAHSA